MSYSTVLFDLDGTLCESAESGGTVYADAFEAAGIEPFGTATELWRALDEPPDHDDPAGHLAAGFARVAARHGRTPVDALGLARGLLDVVDYSNVVPRPGAAEAIEAAGRTARVGVVTNGPESRQAGKLDALPFGDAFGTVVYAADLRRRKPNREPFDRALDALDAAPEEALYVGDSLSFDVAGAQNAGLDAAWCAPSSLDPRPFRPEYVFGSLADLRDLLGEP